MYCNSCGKAIVEDARYCSYCGAFVGQPLRPRALLRPRSDRKVAGVCAGIAHNLELDTTLVRLVWALITLMGGIFPGVIVYILAWVVIPEEPVAIIPVMNVSQP